jgi:hypothetical protein
VSWTTALRSTTTWLYGYKKLWYVDYVEWWHLKKDVAYVVWWYKKNGMDYLLMEYSLHKDG